MGKFIAAAIQMDSQTNRERNLETACALLAQAVSRGAALIVFPECMDYCGPDYAGNAQTIEESEAFSALSVAAKRYGVWVHCGSIHEKRENGLPYNTSFVISPQGEIKSVYRKMHLFDMDLAGRPSVRESHRVSPGREVVTLETGALGTLGLSICYDLRFPEIFRMETLRGAQILCNPACFSNITGPAHWETLLRARAIENGCYVIAPNQIGIKPEMTAFGHSLIIDPWGKVLACLEAGEGIITAEIDTEYTASVRTQTGTLCNRRPELYNINL